MDGNSYEVAGRAVQQLRSQLRIVELSVEAVRLMVRNAELDRQMADGQDPDAVAWENGPQARLLDTLSETLSHSAGRLRLLEQAASYDPKNPPR